MITLVCIDDPDAEFIANAPVTIGPLFIPIPSDEGYAVVYRTLHRNGYEYFGAVGSVLTILQRPDDFADRIHTGLVQAIDDWFDGIPNPLVRDRTRPLTP